VEHCFNVLTHILIPEDLATIHPEGNSLVIVHTEASRANIFVEFKYLAASLVLPLFHFGWQVEKLPILQPKKDVGSQPFPRMDSTSDCRKFLRHSFLRPWLRT